MKMREKMHLQQIKSGILSVRVATNKYNVQ